MTPAGPGLEDFACGQQITHRSDLYRPGGPLGPAWSAAWLSGRHGAYARQGHTRVRPGAPATLPGGRVLWQITDTGDGEMGLLQEGPDRSWLLFAQLMPGRGTAVVLQYAICARTDELAAELAAALTAGSAPEPPRPREVGVTFWAGGPGGARRSHRTISAPPWAEIAGNYTARLRAPLEALMDYRPEDEAGRLVLLHGAAGTGKTTLLRALGLAWRDWCAVQYVTDAGRFLDDAGYVTEVMLDDDASPDQWRLVIAEDCGPLLRGTESGDALATLLNLGDGMLGQGQKLLFALTTNDERGVLDAKLTRPGRCLASLDVPPLAPGEAARWLGRPLPAGTGTDLASLYQLRGGTPIPGASETPAAAGGYL